MRGLVAGSIAVLILASCGGNGTTDATNDTSGTTASAGSERSTEDIDVCGLLTDAEMTAAVGRAPSSRPTDPIGGLTGCSWGTGLIIVQIRNTTTLVTAPLESDCPSADLGEESTVCLGSVKFLTSNNIQATISTIENIEESQLLAVASTILPKLQS